MNSFREFFFKFLKSYIIFGITPYKNLKSSVTLGYVEKSLVVCAVIIYWIGVVFSFSRDIKTDDLVTVANGIQFISKYLTLTIVLIYPLLSKTTMNLIINSFENIDTELRCLQVLPNYNYHIRINNISSIICFLYLIVILVYDFYVVFAINKTADFILYWIIVNIPIITITFAMLQAFAVLYLIKERCELINKVMENLCSRDRVRDIPPINHEVFLCIENNQKNLTSREIFTRISSALTDLGQLSRLVEKFYGPLFFTTFASSFAVICIQMFYCYLIIITHTLSKGYNVWTMISSINIIIINIIMIVSITSICEKVTSEVSIQYTFNTICIYDYTGQ